MIDSLTLKDLEEVLAELHKARQMYTGSRLDLITAKIRRLEALYYSLKEAIQKPEIPTELPDTVHWTFSDIERHL